MRSKVTQNGCSVCAQTREYSSGMFTVMPMEVCNCISRKISASQHERGYPVYIRTHFMCSTYVLSPECIDPLLCTERIRYIVVNSISTYYVLAVNRAPWYLTVSWRICMLYVLPSFSEKMPSTVCPLVFYVLRSKRTPMYFGITI